MLIFVFCILAGILYAINESICKNITEKRYSALSYNFLQLFIDFILILIPFLFFFRLPPLGISYLYIFFVIIILSVGNLFILKAYKTEDVSTVSIVNRISLVITFVLGIFLLSEKFSFYKLVGVLMVITGIIIIFYEGKMIKPSPGLILTLLAGILFGFWAYLEKLIFRDFSILTYYVFLMSGASLPLLFLKATRIHIGIIWRKYKIPMIISKIFYLTGAYLLSWSIKYGSISVVQTTTETVFLLGTVAIGIIVLKEHKNLTKKLTGSLLCTAGIILLNFF